MTLLRTVDLFTCWHLLLAFDADWQRQ